MKSFIKKTLTNNNIDIGEVAAGFCILAFAGLIFSIISFLLLIEYYLFNSSGIDNSSILGVASLFAFTIAMCFGAIYFIGLKNVEYVV